MRSGLVARAVLTCFRRRLPVSLACAMPPSFRADSTFRQLCTLQVVADYLPGGIGTECIHVSGVEKLPERVVVLNFLRIPRDTNSVRTESFVLGNDIKP